MIITGLKLGYYKALNFRVSLASAMLILALCGLGLFSTPVRAAEENKLLLKTNSRAARSFVYPLSGPRISSDFGKRKHPLLGSVRHHDGIDLAAPRGAPVRAIANGLVVFADPRGGYGNLIVVVHSDGLSSHYGHLHSMSVRPGSTIKAGQVIGRVGSTGISTGPHLHFEIRTNGVAGDPEKFIPGLAAAGQG